MNALGFIGSFGFQEILLILLIVVVLFGAKKIPELMRGLGSGIKEFKKASTLEEDESETKKIEK